MRVRPDDDAACRFVTEVLDAHLLGAAQQRRSSSGGSGGGSSRTLVSFSAKESGVGDQLSALLAAATVAVGTGRRLELPPEDAGGAASYITQGFELSFDTTYTGQARWIADAHAWLQGTDYTQLNRSLPLHALPRFKGEGWGLTATVGEPALAARLLIPSPSGHYPPMHPKVLVQPAELFLGGNTGSAVFRAYFERRLQARGLLYWPGLVACALQHLVKPSPAVVALAAAWQQQQQPPQPQQPQQPPLPPPPLVVGVHIRAEAHLLNRAAWRGADWWRVAEGARYTASLAADRVFAGCALWPDGGSGGGRRRRRTRRAAVAQPLPPQLQHSLTNFSEFWLAARATTRWLEAGGASANAAAARLGGGGRGNASSSGSSGSTHAAAASSRSGVVTPGGGAAPVRWLVMSDAVQLKRRAREAWPALVSTTDVVPAQVGACGGGWSEAERRAGVLHAVAELWSLAQASVLILGRSRFPVAALLLSPSCRQSLHLFLDRTCRPKRRRRGRAVAAAAATATAGGVGQPHHEAAVPLLDMRETHRKALRCIGTDGAYSARRLQDAQGRLLTDGMLSNF